MKSGNEKNVANFETVTIILEGLGAVYNPAQALISLTALQAALAEARAAIAAVDTMEAEKAIAIDERQGEFFELDKFVVNIKRAAEVELDDAAFTEDLQSFVNRFNGGGSAPNPAAETPPPGGAPPPKNTHSTSQRSHDDQLAHLAGIIALLRTKPDYKPNDPEFQLTAIEARHAALEAKNNAANAAIAALGNAHDARDRVLYDPRTGLLKRVKLIRTQLARKPGRESAAYQQVNALVFRKN